LIIRPTYGPADLAGFFPNLGREQLDERVLEPYRQGTSITASGATLQCAEITQIRILQTKEPLTEPRFKKGSSSAYPFLAYQDDELKVFSMILSEIGEDVTDEFITGPPGHERQASPDSTQEHSPPADAREVFVVHGRNEAARRALFEFLRAIDLRPLEWAEAVQSTGGGAPYVGQILDAAFSRAHAVVVLMTPDDEVRLRSSFRSESERSREVPFAGQARPNVLFEAGMAVGRNPERTVFVEIGELRPFSDVEGRHVIRPDRSTEWRRDLSQRLETVGCPVNLAGDDWLTAGDFDAVFDVAEEPFQSADGEGSQPDAVVARQRSDEAEALLLEAARDGGDGAIVITRTSGGVIIQANRKSFGEHGNRRSEAKWGAGIEELLHLEFINDPYGEGKYFEVTHEGFQMADELRKSQ
jgi:predicted nucleotide-binding protein